MRTPPANSGQDITVTGVAVAAGAAQIELSGVGFDAAFASSFLTNYTGGITYHVDGTTDVPILLADILSVTYSESSSVLRIQLDYTNGHSLTAAAGAGTLGGTGTDADLITFNGVAGIADAADLSVVEAGSGGGSGNPISLVYGLLDGDGNANQIGITATMSEKVLAGSSLTVTFGTGGTAVLTADTSDATGLTMSGTYTVREGDDTTSLNITGVEVTSGGNVYDAYGNAMTSPAIPNGENLADNSDIEIDADGSGCHDYNRWL